MYDTAKSFKTKIREMIRRTWDTQAGLEFREGLYPSFNGHPGRQIDHTDGIGTKGIIHWNLKTFAAAVQDALAMNLNDLAMVGAKAFKTQCHLMVPDDNHDVILAIMKNLVDQCCHWKIALTGGETSVHDNLIGMELSLSMSGIVSEKEFGTKVQKGDRLIYLKSNGIHSNGLTFARGIVAKGKITPEELVSPTSIYAHLLLGRHLPIHAAMHITGGAFSKLKDILPDNLDIAFLKAEVPPLFFKLRDALDWGSRRMYSTFNCGVGMVLAVAPSDAEWVATAVGGTINGEVVDGTGTVRVESAFESGRWALFN